MEIIKGNSSNFDELIKSGKVLVDFNADWCGPCKMLAPILEDIASKNENVKIVSINIDDEDELSEKYNVSSIPCLVLFKDGEEVNRSVGLKPQEEIENFIGE